MKSHYKQRMVFERVCESTLNHHSLTSASCVALKKTHNILIIDLSVVLYGRQDGSHTTN